MLWKTHKPFGSSAVEAKTIIPDVNGPSFLKKIDEDHPDTF
jgi:hypothetical protein